MKKYGKNELSILLLLADEKGHCNEELAHILMKDEDNTKKDLEELVEANVICRGGYTKTSNPFSSHPNQPVIPYYLVKNIEIFESIVRPLSEIRKTGITFERGGSNKFHKSDFVNPARMAYKLHSAEDAFSKYAYSKFSDRTKRLFNKYFAEKYKRKDEIIEDIRSALTKELNNLIENDNLYDGERIKGILLLRDTKELIQINPHGEKLVCLNKILLQDAYPDEIVYEEICPFAFDNFILSEYTCEIIKQYDLEIVCSILKSEFSIAELRSFAYESVKKGCATNEEHSHFIQMLIDDGSLVIIPDSSST
jgi:hypothetical protein